MGRKILVLGGTRFFGRDLVHKLIANGDQITVASHNFSKVHLPQDVKTFFFEREDPSSLAQLCESDSFDLVYDQICYSPTAADLLCTSLKDKVGRLIHTSTQSVYVKNDRQREDAFDPYQYPLRLGLRAEFNYAEGKRLAEAVYMQKASFPVTAVRLPFVLGMQDYTGRLEFHIERIAAGRPIVAANPLARMSMISAGEAADFLFWVGQQKIDGPINACSHSDDLCLATIVGVIEKVLEKSAHVLHSGDPSDESPYVSAHSRFLDNSKAQNLGFKFLDVLDWLPPLVREKTLKRE